MLSSQQPIKLLYNEDGSLCAALLHPDLWSILQPEVLKILNEKGLALKSSAPQAPSSSRPTQRSEPISDWEELTAYWDFSYPVDYDVSCEHCGAHTDNWQQDNPRTFCLSAANLGGLVSFECQRCGARIVKKHFEDVIATECTPPQQQDPRKMGKYSTPSGLAANGSSPDASAQED
ncbi:MAG: hypothetical protein AB7D07_04210 [Desulfovibrionaceae bacterium]